MDYLDDIAAHSFMLLAKQELRCVMIETMEGYVHPLYI